MLGEVSARLGPVSFCGTLSLLISTIGVTLLALAMAVCAEVPSGLESGPRRAILGGREAGMFASAAPNNTAIR